MSRRYLLLKRYHFPDCFIEASKLEAKVEQDPLVPDLPSGVVNIHYRKAFWKAYRRGYRCGVRRGEVHGCSQGEKSGYAAGFEDGQEKGYRLGYGDGFQTGESEAQNLLAILNQLWLHVSGLEKQYWEQLEFELTGVVECICRKVVREELQTSTTALKVLVQETLELLPREADLRIFVNPKDKSTVERLSDKYPEQWQVITDEGITPGGCTIQVGSGSADARVETRLNGCFEEMKESLEKNAESRP
ncbi:FliH/SctL family protein [Parendozoicomonas sp. Alg238-R29]|uniref:FliH/SctL family protein n=1 Tax=Parendozoicomonas sp. Alg238-R29 TaxID=2993446 RepID=UPI00248EAA4B|nr:FliH/SctL family protein [Parendozoicomonas sp. Alg238-R29]